MPVRALAAVVLLAFAASASSAQTAQPVRPRADALISTYTSGPAVTPLPDSVRRRFNLDTTFYSKYTSADGIPVIASARVPDEGLSVAGGIMRHMLSKRPDLRADIIARGGRVGIMGVTGMTTDVPEQRDWKKPALDDRRLTDGERARYNEPGGIGSMTDKEYWDRRARGMGGTFTTGAEENVLGYPGTRYFGEHILIHEFSHSIQGAVRRVDPALEAELEAAFQEATEKKLYINARGVRHYAVNTLAEYWAEGTQWWFWNNYPEVFLTNGVQVSVWTPEELERYDPKLFAVLAKVYPDHHIPADVYYGKKLRPIILTPGAAAASARLDSVRGDTTRVLEFLREMPKGGDLHTHLGGAIRAELIVDWAAADGLCFVPSTASLARPPCDGADRISANRFLTDTALRSRALDAWTMRNWKAGTESGADHFFATFGKTGAIGITRLGEMLADVTSRAAAQRVLYMEIMTNPDDGSIARLGLRLGPGTDYARMQARLDSAGVRDSLRAASARLDAAIRRQREIQRCGTPAADAGCDVTVRFIYQVTRSRNPEQVFAQLYAGMEWPALDSRFVSVNMVAPEHGPVAVRAFDLHMRMIDWLHASHPNVNLTLHAGELSEKVTDRSTMRSHIRQSVELGHASRIGHGVDALQEDDPESLFRLMLQRGVLVEIGLTSNDYILGVRGSAHPLAAYLARGVPVALATDDEGVSRSDMTHEYLRAVVDQKLDYPTLKAMARNSIDYSFAPDTTKARVRASLDSSFTRFEATIRRP